MRAVRSFVPLAAAIATTLLSGCAGTPPAGRAPSTAPQSTASPMDERERIESERFGRATAGLHLTTPAGLAEVDALVTGSPLEATRLLALADESLATNHEFEALEQYVLAARNDPARSESFVGIGRVLKRKGRLDDAETSFRTALDRDSENLAARYELAMTMWSASRREDAIAEMSAVVAADPEHGRAHERLAVWSYYTGDLDAARQHLREAERLGQPVPAQLAGLLERDPS